MREVEDPSVVEGSEPVGPERAVVVVVRGDLRWRYIDDRDEYASDTEMLLI